MGKKIAIAAVAALVVTGIVAAVAIKANDSYY